MPQVALRRFSKHRLTARASHLVAFISEVGISLWMLKIQISRNEDSTIVALSGRIDDEGLSQLRTLVQAEQGLITLDLKEVTLVGREAIRFLAQCEQAGATIQNCSAYIREWIFQHRRSQ